ncbi:MAG: hypothetical protein EXR68_00815 [Dehalococcoidia bacterium]|nr:hypothetical protein [Dehalococcoidia bacterium]
MAVMIEIDAGIALIAVYTDRGLWMCFDASMQQTLRMLESVRIGYCPVGQDAAVEELAKRWSIRVIRSSPGVY